MTTFDRPTDDWTRDQYGRPKIMPPPGVEWRADPKPGRKTGAKQPHRGYTRVTTFAGALDDQSNLTRWKIRRALLGMSRRPDYVTSAAALTADDRDRSDLDALAEKCLEAAGPNAADLGTALHGFTERLDRGEPLGFVPEEYRADLAAYVAKRDEVGMRYSHVEVRLVCDEHETAGTPDRFGWLDVPDPDGVVDELRVIDVKTGRVDYPLKFSTQLAEYSHSALYDTVTGERTPLAVNRRWGLIIELPVGRGECRLHWLDLTVGQQGIDLAGPVRRFRKIKADQVLRPVGDEPATVPADEPEQNGNPAPVTGMAEPEAAADAARDAGLVLEQPDRLAVSPNELLRAIAQLQDKHQAAALYRQHAAVWQPQHTEAVGLKLAELAQEQEQAKPRAALASAISTAADPGAVTALWRQHHGTPTWTAEHDELSRARVQELTA